MPVLNLEPQILKLWARVIASFGNASISTYLFDLPFIKEIEPQVKEDNNKSAAQISPKEQAEIIVKRFLATASLTAQRLAGMMAAAPVDMSVVNLIRKKCLGEAQPVHVAEVYMGGLLHAIEEDTQGKARVYDFLPGVRKELNQAMAINETEGILDAISQYIGDKLDKSIHSFTALIASLPEYSEIDQEKVLPFAKIAVDVFRNIGGEYADLAEKVSESLQRNPSPPDKPEEPLEPVLETIEFEVAFIEILKTQTFNFVVATLERESKRRFWDLLSEQTIWVIKRQQKQGIGIIEELSEGINLELMKIPEGTFLMGSPKDERERYSNESPQHQVTVQPFFMGKYAVTQAQWQAVASLPQVNRELNPNPSEFKSVNRPVERVSWYDAVEFCDRLSQHTGKSYRLPSEAEWEYACRAGTTTPFHFGETITSELANYNATITYGAGVKGTYREETTQVGSFGVANAFGLDDMHGNVWEWCLDDWHDNYEGAPGDGSPWYDDNNNFSQNKRIAMLRGGSWLNNPEICRSASRDYYGAERDSLNVNVSFRVVCAVGRILR
ncbi:MAG: formylglycine-generating enzyme family protein [Rhizonema sp. PD38]|nr:formylglycine-generating enzyme family protein [Rhizonema sp. PD38]